MSTVSQALIVERLTHASRVMAVVRSREGASATVTQSFTPSNDRALPNLPEVVTLPAASRARAVSVWVPFVAVVVFQETEYGAVVSSAPRVTPSSRNCTPVTPTLSEASAVTATVPETVAPPAGLVTLTAGGVVSGVNVKRIALPLPTYALVALNWASSLFAPWVP